MKKICFTMTALVLSLAMAWVAYARDEKYLLSINAALQATDIKYKPDGSVKFFFANQKTPQILKKLGSDSAHEKVSTRAERDESSCNAAFLEALVALQKRAQKAGANAVVNIVSYYRKDVTSSATEFETMSTIKTTRA